MISTNLKSLHTILDAYKRRIDTFSEELAGETARFNSEFPEEKFAKAFIEGKRVENNDRVDQEYRQKVTAERKRAEPVVNSLLRKIREGLEEYANKPPRPEFVNRVQLYYTMGMVENLTTFEIRTLANDCKNYAEKRIVSEIIEKKRAQADKNGQSFFFNLSIDIPKIEEASMAFEVLEDRCHTMINDYSGRNGNLSKFSKDGVQPEYAVNCAVVLEDENYFGNFSAYVKPIDAEWIEEPLTQEQMDMLDTIVDASTEYGRNERVKAISKTSPELAELFRKSPRYAEYVPVEE